MATPCPACSVEGCDRRRRSKGMCGQHYERHRLGHPDPDGYIVTRASRLIRNAAGEKRCATCEKWVAESGFKPDKRLVDGLSGSCTRCLWGQRLQSKFGLSADAWEKTFESQGERCAVCRSAHHNGLGWHTDHDHACCPGERACGKCVRGILCFRCNIVLGHCEGDPRLLGPAYVTYLEAWADAKVFKL